MNLLQRYSKTEDLVYTWKGEMVRRAHLKKYLKKLPNPVQWIEKLMGRLDEFIGSEPLQGRAEAVRFHSETLRKRMEDAKTNRTPAKG